MPLIQLRNVEVDFPFEPYSVQLDYMTKVIEALQTNKNAILESPTGTGKTLCLLCSTLAWRKAEIAKQNELAQANQFQVSNDLPEGLSAWASSVNDRKSACTIPKIIYASRTHSQLTQVVKELKQSTYGKSVIISVLGSREQMCVHPEVSIQSNNQTMVHMCRNKVNKRMCYHYNNVENAVKNGVFTNKVMDIEDLVMTGKQHSACPYYSAREASKQADCAIIFTPYNYLLDKRSRHSQNLDVAGNILIFDEAHNLEKQCEESASFDVTSLDFAHCVDEVGDLLRAVTKMSESGVVADGHEAGQSSALSDFNVEELALLKSFFMRLEKELDEIELPESKQKAEEGNYIFDYFSKVNLTFDTCDVLIELMEKVFSYLSTLSTSFRTRGVALQKFIEIIKIVFNRGLNVDGFGVDKNSLRDQSARHYRVHISEETDAPKKSDNLLKKKATKPSRTLSYWCFSPGYAMKELISHGLRSLVLTSGTLTPIHSFVAELQVDFPIQLQNSHVIEDYQVFVASLAVGVGGRKLEATYRSRFDVDKVMELGRTVLEIFRLSPGGVLVFFPSYSALNHYVSSWQERSNLKEMFECAKSCTIEPQRKAEMKQAMEKYYDDVKSEKGGALFAVCRGKISEGLDFSNENGRTVIIIGIPFPPVMDPKVKLKMTFLDDQRRSRQADVAIPGGEWYRQQACRAVNQAIGRVIRHHNDFGAIVLCDYRYSRQEQKEELPMWLRSRVNEFKDCAKFLRRFKAFFCSVKRKEKLQYDPVESSSEEFTTEEEESSQSCSSQQLSFSTTQERIRKLPKGNQLDIHVPSTNSAWAQKYQQTFCDTDQVCSPKILIAEKSLSSTLLSSKPQQKTPVNLLDALDGAALEEKNFENDEIENSSKDQILGKKQPEAKRRKIIVKPYSSSIDKSSISEESNGSEAAGTSKLVYAEELLAGTASSFLNVIRQCVTHANYLKFKTLSSSYRKDANLQVLFNGLSQFLLLNEQSREILKAFHRFLCVDHREQFRCLVEAALS